MTDQHDVVADLRERLAIAEAYRALAQDEIEMEQMRNVGLAAGSAMLVTLVLVVVTLVRGPLPVEVVGAIGSLCFFLVVGAVHLGRLLRRRRA